MKGKKGWFPSWIKDRESKKNFKKSAAKYTLVPKDGDLVLARKVTDDVLGIESVLRVPTTEEQVTALLYKVHCAAEGGNQDGRDKMIRKLGFLCSFHGWRKLVELVLRSCAVCQASVGPRPCEPLRPILASGPLEHCFLDYVQLAHTPADGKFYVLVLVDHFSKYVWARLTLDREATTVERFLADVFKKHAPLHLQADNGREFRAAGERFMRAT